MALRTAPVLRLVFVLALLVLAALAIPQQNISIPTVTVHIGSGAGLPGHAGVKPQTEVANTLQIVALLTILSLAPSILILTTAFTRIVIIFSFVRSALGTPAIPPNQVLIGLSLFLTCFVMQPTMEKVYNNAVQPYMEGKMPIEQATAIAKVPIRDFMLRSTYRSDLKLFLDMRHQHPKNRSELDFFSLIPAFIISELKTAFIIGFYIFIPFLIIDLIVASSLMSMGMMMMPPTVVSLPAKILVFVLADGWGTLIGSILQGYR